VKGNNFRGSIMKKLYPLFGIIGPLIYILAVFLGGAIRHDYNLLYNSISELSMLNAPNKLLRDVLFGIYNVFIIFFGLGAYSDSNINNKKFNIAAFMLVVIGILGLLVLVFTQDPRGVPATLSGNLHVILSGITAALTIISVIFVGMGFREYTNRKIFIWYSFITAITILVFGGISAGSFANNSSFGGLFERLTIFLFMIWVIILSYIILTDKTR